MKISNAVILARSNSLVLKDKRISKCVILYSLDTNKFVRIYPTHYSSKKTRIGNLITAPVISDNKSDWRPSSYKLRNSKNLEEATMDINVKKELEKAEFNSLIIKLKKKCSCKMDYKNESITIVRAKINKIGINNKHLCVTYNCAKDCGAKTKHKQQVLDDRLYWLTEYRYSWSEQAMNFFKLNNDDYDKYFVLGNSYKHAKSFMIIAIHPILKDNF